MKNKIRFIWLPKKGTPRIELYIEPWTIFQRDKSCTAKSKSWKPKKKNFFALIMPKQDRYKATDRNSNKLLIFIFIIK